MKKLKYIIPLILISFSLQSCKKIFYNLIWDDYYEDRGYITDTLGNGIENVKITILKADCHTCDKTETDIIFYTDENGYYEIKIDNKDYIYFMKFTHENYIYPILNNYWPQLNPGEAVYENNYEMVKKGKVKIEGNVRYETLDTTIWLGEAKISVLKRPNGNTDYPEPIGVETYSDNEGMYYIEFEGDENFEFFLKPEKDGYYYEYLGNDYIEVINEDQGYVDKQGFFMEKEE